MNALRKLRKRLNKITRKSRLRSKKRKIDIVATRKELNRVYSEASLMSFGISAAKQDTLT